MVRARAHALPRREKQRAKMKELREAALEERKQKMAREKEEREREREAKKAAAEAMKRWVGQGRRGVQWWRVGGAGKGRGALGELKATGKTTGLSEACSIANGEERWVRLAGTCEASSVG